MSVFEDQTPVGGESEGNQEGTPTHLESLVGEGKKFSDVEALAKGKAEADALIVKLQAKAEEYKQQDYAKKLLEEMQVLKTTEAPVVPVEPNKSAVPEGDTLPQGEDLESLLEKALQKRDAQSTVQKNLSTVNAALEASYGTEADTVVATKATELGMTKQALQDVASTSPTAFLTLIGAPQKEVSVPQDSTVTTHNHNPNVRDVRFYNKMRKDNPSLFKTPSTQKQMMEDKNKLGAKFF